MNTETTNAHDVLVAQIRAILPTATHLMESGDYGTGFWRNELRVDLEDLQAGKLSAFHVVEDIPATAGMSFREYYGIDAHARLPHGVSVDAIAELCAGIYEDWKATLEGFSVEWVNGNEKAVWEDAASRDHYEKPSYWSEGFRSEVDDLACGEVYDLSDSENVPFVQEAIESSFPDIDLSDRGAVAAAIDACYAPDSSDPIFNGRAGAINRIVERNGE